MCLTANDPNAAVYTAADTGLLLTQVPEEMVKMEMFCSALYSSTWMSQEVSKWLVNGF